jgi:hypothetical protein
MGRFWGSTPSGEGSQEPAKMEGSREDFTTSTDKDMKEQPHPTLTRDEQALADLKNLVKEFAAEDQRHNKSRTSKTDGSDSSSTPSISPDSLFPVTMSCRQAFDSAFYCQSMGGQFNNLYRNGKMRDCSENWRNFWFCMRTKSQPTEKRKAMIQEHYRQRADKYKVGPSSEDIWEMRTEPVENAFALDPDDYK